MRLKGLFVGIAGLAVIAALAACSQQEIVVDGSRPTGTAAPGSTPTTQPHDETASLAEQVASRLNTAPVAALGPVERRTLLGIGLRAAGLTAEEAGCITSDPQVGDDPGVASPIQGVPPAVIGRCVAGPRLAQLASNPSLDLGAISLDDLSAVMAPALRAALEAAGLQPAEADCVAKATSAAVDPSGLAGLLASSAKMPSIDAATVTRCIGASRLAELAG